MMTLRWIAILLIAAALITGALTATPQRRSAASVDGYQILAADFHNHSFPGDWATLAPWDVILEAKRANLDVIALTSHNHVWSGRLGQWLARYLDGPLVIVGEEIVGPAPHYHLLAIGIHSTIDSRISAARAIDEIHRQAGVAIAAHPVLAFLPSYDAAARQLLDGAEVLHPLVYDDESLAAQLRDFYASGTYAAVGDSDYRGLGQAGICRTFIFARERTEQGVLNAIRERHTVVYGQGGYYGDPQLIELAKRRQLSLESDADGGDAGKFSTLPKIAGGFGLSMLILLGPAGFRRRRQTWTEVGRHL
jgi:hypothetical protein